MPLHRGFRLRKEVQTETERSRTHMAGHNSRYDELKGILEERRREIMNEVQGRMRDVRSEGAGSAVQGVLDAAESSELDIQDEIEFALIQMKAETLNKIDEALRRLEEAREIKQQRDRLMAQRRGAASLFIDMQG